MVAAVMALVREAHPLLPRGGVIVRVRVAAAVGRFDVALSCLRRPRIALEIEPWRGRTAPTRRNRSAVVFTRLVPPSLRPARPLQISIVLLHLRAAIERPLSGMAILAVITMISTPDRVTALVIGGWPMVGLAVMTISPIFICQVLIYGHLPSRPVNLIPRWHLDSGRRGCRVRRIIDCVLVLAPRKAPDVHLRVEPEDRIVSELGPGGMLPDREAEFLLIVVLEEDGLDASRIVRRRNRRVVGVFGRERDANRVGRLGGELQEPLLQLLFQLGIPPVVVLLLLVLIGRLFFDFGFGGLLVLILGVLGRRRLLIAARSTSLPLISRAAFPTLVVTLAVPIAVTMWALRCRTFLMPAALCAQGSLVGRWRGR